MNNQTELTNTQAVERTFCNLDGDRFPEGTEVCEGIFIMVCRNGRWIRKSQRCKDE